MYVRSRPKNPQSPDCDKDSAGNGNAISEIEQKITKIECTSRYFSQDSRFTYVALANAEATEMKSQIGRLSTLTKMLGRSKRQEKAEEARKRLARKAAFLRFHATGTWVDKSKSKAQDCHGFTLATRSELFRYSDDLLVLINDGFVYDESDVKPLGIDNVDFSEWHSSKTVKFKIRTSKKESIWQIEIKEDDQGKSIVNCGGKKMVTDDKMTEAQIIDKLSGTYWSRTDDAEGQKWTAGLMVTAKGDELTIVPSSQLAGDAATIEAKGKIVGLVDESGAPKDVTISGVMNLQYEWKLNNEKFNTEDNRKLNVLLAQLAATGVPPVARTESIQTAEGTVTIDIEANGAIRPRIDTGAAVSIEATGGGQMPNIQKIINPNIEIKITDGAVEITDGSTPSKVWDRIKEPKSVAGTTSVAATIAADGSLHIESDLESDEFIRLRDIGTGPIDADAKKKLRNDLESAFCNQGNVEAVGLLTKTGEVVVEAVTGTCYDESEINFDKIDDSSTDARDRLSIEAEADFTSRPKFKDHMYEFTKYEINALRMDNLGTDTWRTMFKSFDSVDPEASHSENRAATDSHSANTEARDAATLSWYAVIYNRMRLKRFLHTVVPLVELAMFDGAKTSVDMIPMGNEIVDKIKKGGRSQILQFVYSLPPMEKAVRKDAGKGSGSGDDNNDGGAEVEEIPLVWRDFQTSRSAEVRELRKFFLQFKCARRAREDKLEFSAGEVKNDVMKDWVDRMGQGDQERHTRFTWGDFSQQSLRKMFNMNSLVRKAVFTVSSLVDKFRLIDEKDVVVKIAKSDDNALKMLRLNQERNRKLKKAEDDFWTQQKFKRLTGTDLDYKAIGIKAADLVRQRSKPERAVVSEVVVEVQDSEGLQLFLSEQTGESTTKKDGLPVTTLSNMITYVSVVRARLPGGRKESHGNDGEKLMENFKHNDADDAWVVRSKMEKSIREFIDVMFNSVKQSETDNHTQELQKMFNVKQRDDDFQKLDDSDLKDYAENVHSFVGDEVTKHNVKNKRKSFSQTAAELAFFDAMKVNAKNGDDDEMSEMAVEDLSQFFDRVEYTTKCNLYF